MAPRSPTHAFDPTPAVEHDPFNSSSSHNPSASGFSNDATFRSVHFSDPPSLPASRHSIATTHVPLLQSVSSASQIPKQSFRILDPPSGIDINAYIQNSRILNEQLRQAHETERKAWGIERSALKARIAELESVLNRSRDPKRRSSNDSSAASAQSFRADFHTQYNLGPAPNGPRKISDTALSSAPPVWKGPESTPPVTRVFSHDNDQSHLPSISEDEPFPSLCNEISPTTREDAVPVPIEQLDKSLDGITLKSTGPALTSSFIAKISSPQFGSPSRSPSPRPKTHSSTSRLSVGMENLLDPLDEKLTRHAGHTPMAFDGALSTSVTTTNVPSPRQEKPPAPAPSTRPPLRPSENSDSYFSTTNVPSVNVPLKDGIPEEAMVDPETQFEAQDDPALKGPLMLDSSAKSQAASTFLDQVDAKLLEAATRGRSDTIRTEDSEALPNAPPVTGVATNGSKTADEERNNNNDGNGNGNVNGRGYAGGHRSGNGIGHENIGAEKKAVDDDIPQLKMKKSTNFGSAWGHVPRVS